jgi:hypothetical protein
MVLCHQSLGQSGNSSDSIPAKTKAKILLKKDSVTERVKTKIASPMDSIRGGLLNYPDKATQKITEFTDSLQSKITTPISNLQDSINSKVEHQISNVQNKLEPQINTVKEKVEAKTLDKLSATEENVESKITNTQENIESKIESTTEGLTDKLPQSDKLKIPDTNLPNTSAANLEKISTGIDDVKIPGVKSDLPSTEIPSLPDADLKTQVPELKTPDLKVPDLKEIDKVNELSGEADKISGQADKITEQVNVDKYTKELDNIKTDVPTDANELSKQAEDKAGEFTGIKSLDADKTKLTAEQTKILDQQAKYNAMLQKYRDKKLIQDEVKRKATSIANDELAKHAKEIQAGQKQLSKSKKGLAGIKSVKDIFRKRSTELEGKKFYQRINPGITWQIYNHDYVSIDFGLQAGYRVSPKFTAGIGGVYRVGFSDDFDGYVKGLQTYGGRVYAELAIAKGVFAHGEFEMLKVNPAIRTNTVDPVNDRVSGSYFGLGKRFKLSRTIRGNIQGLYRVEYNGELPDVNTITARFGIEYFYRKPKKKLTY